MFNILPDKPLFKPSRHLVTVVILLSVFSSCRYENGEELYPVICDTTQVTYSGQIEPIISNNCYTCHDLVAQPSSIVLQGYANLKVKVDDGKLVCAINHNAGCQPMPRNAAKLSDCNIRLIEKWIENGAPNN